MDKGITPKQQDGSVIPRPADFIDLPEPQEVVKSLEDSVGRRLSTTETIAFFEFARSSDAVIAAKAAGITKSELSLMMNEEWWMKASTMFLYAYQEQFVHGMMSTGSDLLDSWKKGIDGTIPPEMFKNVIKAAEVYAKLGRDEMRPLMSNKHEIDIRQQTVNTEIKITADLTAKMTDNEIMELNLYGKMPDKRELEARTIEIVAKSSETLKNGE